MFSELRKGLFYSDVSQDIMSHDEDIEAEIWSYDNRDVYRGNFDPEYTKHNLIVYWLYDTNLNRIGLAEHDIDEPEIFKALWYKDNPYATLYQNNSWKSSNKTLWSFLTPEAYQDCLEEDFKTIFDRCLTSKYRLVTPEFLIHPPTIYHCKDCNKKSIKPLKSCINVYESNYFDHTSLLFIDSSFIVYLQSNEPTAQRGDDEQELSLQEHPKILPQDQKIQLPP